MKDVKKVRVLVKDLCIDNKILKYIPRGKQDGQISTAEIVVFIRS